MVNRQYQQTVKGLGGEPPPLDDSWWESVLAEEDILVMGNDHSHAGYKKKTDVQSNAHGNEAYKVDWDKAIRLYRADELVQLHVSGYNRGGLLVDGDGIYGFVPVSHLVEYPANVPECEQEQILEDYQERYLSLKVIECDPQRGRVVFSERAALADPGSRNELFEQLKHGECVCGTVTNITDFGAFVDLGGVEGLVHVSEISWGRVRHPCDVVKVGDRVRAFVIQVFAKRSRVALSLKRLCTNPWETVHERYHAGQIIDATITSIVTYGAFARLEEGLDGLIHVTECTNAQVKGNPLRLLREGQQVRVKVLQVDAVKQRLGLSLQAWL